MSSRLFETLRPYIQAMIDNAGGVGDPTIPAPGEGEPGNYAYTWFRDNYTWLWHRVFVYDGKMYIESSGTIAGGDPSAGSVTLSAPGQPAIEAPGTDAEIEISALNSLVLSGAYNELTTIR